MRYPTKKEVMSASFNEISDWYRSLEVAQTKQEKKILRLIMQRFKAMGGSPSELEYYTKGVL